MRTTLSRTSNLLAVAMGVLVTSAAAAHAQGAPVRRVFVDVGAGGQVSTRTFSESSAFTVFNETALVATNQATGRGFVFDVNGGYRFARNLHFGVGFWVARPDGASASAASIPDPLVFNRPKTLTFTAADRKI